MRDKNKTKDQLIDELVQMRRRIKEMEKSEVEKKPSERDMKAISGTNEGSIRSISELKSIMKLSDDDPVAGNLQVIRQEIERMGSITRKLQKIARYKTMDYIEGKRIVDINNASDMVL